MLRVRVLVAMAMAIGARAAITENIAHVTNIQTSPPAVEFVNTGQKAITGVAIRRLSPLPTDVIWADFYESPIEPHQTMKVIGWDVPGVSVEIAAVIFIDGTTAGGPIDRGDGQDLLAGIFTRRKAESREWARWKMMLDHEGPEKFVQAAERVEILKDPLDMEQSGRAAVLHPVQALAESAKVAHAHGDESVLLKLPQIGEQRHMKAESSARRRVVGDVGVVEGGIGEAINQQPSPGKHGSNVELLSDPMGVDFRPYVLQILSTVRRNWFTVMPESAKSGRARGKVVVQFAIANNGAVTKAVFAAQSGTDTLDRAAVASISLSNPFPPRPVEFRGSVIRLQFTFTYNARPR